MPPRSGLPVSTPLSNPPEVHPPNPISIPGSVPIPNPPSSQNYSIQDRSQIQNYPAMDPQQNYQDLKFQGKKLPPESQYPHYGVHENVLQYSNHVGSNYNSQHPIYSQNYSTPQSTVAPPATGPLPSNYPINYPSQQAFQQNPNYSSPSERDYNVQGPVYGPQQNYRYSDSSYMKPDGSYSDYSRLPHQEEGYSRENLPPAPPALPPPPSIHESYVLTQLTDSSKSNYPVQSFPISESSFNQPDYHQMFPEENKGFGGKPSETGPPLQNLNNAGTEKIVLGVDAQRSGGSVSGQNENKPEPRGMNECIPKSQ